MEELRPKGYWRTKEGRKEYYHLNKHRWKNRKQRTKEEAREYQKEYRKKYPGRHLEAKQEKRQRRLAWAISYLGGRCNSCNKEYPIGVYDFHHIEQATKIFDISSHMNVGEEKFKEEVKKCMLLCANCHRMFHLGQNKGVLCGN